ncbi:elongation factor Tu domain 2/elongation factor G Cterminus domain containing protein [Acanthamoeba castellanii str. Neff]|uniref:Elongation factor Tu domain 2/elongation factor G Cterminus domain containing protein n=1 Tax=Acanthamoeba castellanii (strain ATCC 30010 / Neff) TaxID=1257118 RepID=L8GMB2_ACACF|nr:elongation factor Tu domain 2/elongation factor G Cterminus domain containing protein [Acanthamoeba castellanii str. Neff]ELR13366.1 elongation factor Tu domain 2/elongation factor G Cterminus domain containing protein [Acanthamoeba castellanii str. Neff]
MGEPFVQPDQGTVAFASGLHGWGFTLTTFATILGKQLGVAPEKLQKRLWGDNFYDPDVKKWLKTDISPTTGKKLKRGFCQFVLAPIYRIIKGCLGGPEKRELLDKNIQQLGIELKAAEKALEGKDLMKCVMPKFLPLGTALLEMMVRHLPSPVQAQRYRVENLYEGPMDDECADAVRRCDPEGPLMVYISKLVPSPDQGSRFYAFGRVFSGTARTGQKVRILGPDYIPGQKSDLYVKNIQKVCVAMGRYFENMDSVPAGNTVCLVGLDQFLIKSGTVTTSEVAHNFRMMKFSVSPVVRVAVQPKNAADVPKLAEGLRKLIKTDPCVQCSIDEATGEMIVAAAGELHLEIVLDDLAKLSRVEFHQSDPVTSFRETVTERTPEACLAKSPNKHNRLWVSAEPFPEGLADAVESGGISIRTEAKELGRELSDRFGWDPLESRKIWRAVMRGARFNIADVTLHADAIHHGAGQIIPAARRVLYAAQLSARPRLMEPMYLVEIQTEDSAMGSVYSVLSMRRGHVFSSEQREGTPIYTLKAYLPVMESFGFTSALREATGGNAFPQCVFDHWQAMSGDPLDPYSTVGKAVLGVRKRKGLKAELPTAASFMDKL